MSRCRCGMIVRTGPTGERVCPNKCARPVKRISDKRLKKLGGKVPFSTIGKKSPIKKGSRPKPIPKVNYRRKAKRTAGYRKMLAGKEYKAARKEAMARAGDRCELWLSWTDRRWEHGGPPIPFGYTGTTNATTTHLMRCDVTYDLHAHHKSYPKTRPLAASDLTICCKPHHEYLESLKPHKQRMF